MEVWELIKSHRNQHNRSYNGKYNFSQIRSRNGWGRYYCLLRRLGILTEIYILLCL